MLLVFSVAFVASHFVLSSHPVRSRLVARLGLGGFLGFYSLVSFATLIPMALAYDGPQNLLYTPPAWGRHANHVLSLLAFVFLVGGVSSPSPTAVGGKVDERAPRAFVTVSRHTGLWGFGLWALGHLLVRGDQDSITLFVAIATLAFGGMLHIDARRRRRDPESWDRFAAQTSLLPFGAAIAGRVRVDWRGVLPRALIGLALGLVVAYAHGWIIGVSAGLGP
ncbi:MAG: NnrU family protein [Myxococcota bacterium]